MTTECANNQQQNSSLCRDKNKTKYSLKTFEQSNQRKDFQDKEVFYLSVTTMTTSKVFVVLLLISTIVFCAENKGMRRLVRRKILRRPVQEVVEAYEADSTPAKSRAFLLETEEAEMPEVIEEKEIEPADEESENFDIVDEDRSGRG